MVSDERAERAQRVIAGLKQVYPDATCALNFKTPRPGYLRDQRPISVRAQTPTFG